MEQVLILDDVDRMLGVLELKNWRHIETIRKFFFELVIDRNKFDKVLPSLSIKRRNIDINNRLEIDVETCFSELSCECVRVDIFGDDGVIMLQLIPVNKTIKIGE